MYGFSELKKVITVTDNQVECPVLDCTELVDKQTISFKRQDQFQCPIHKIFISPSTFEYEEEKDNLLWDFDLFEEHKKDKRESRIARDNSEDAVTWNVFRFLENNHLLDPFLSDIAGMNLGSAETVFWSYNRKELNSWSLLKEARQTFWETDKRGSEPDLIIITDSILFFVEAKLTAGNETVPSNPSDPKKYTTGAEKLFSRIFVPGSDFATIAVMEKKYELMRFWLLGSWMAKQKSVNFVLINLVCEDRDTDIEQTFGKYLLPDTGNRFMRSCWEDIYRFIAASQSRSAEEEKIMNYFRNKTIGYKDGELQKAFRV